MQRNQGICGPRGIAGLTNSGKVEHQPTGDAGAKALTDEIDASSLLKKAHGCRCTGRELVPLQSEPAPVHDPSPSSACIAEHALLSWMTRGVAKATIVDGDDVKTALRRHT